MILIKERLELTNKINLPQNSARIRVISRTLNPMMERIEVDSELWRYHSGLRQSFERVHSNSGLLLNALSNLFQVSNNGINYLNDLLTGMDSRP